MEPINQKLNDPFPERKVFSLASLAWLAALALLVFSLWLFARSNPLAWVSFGVYFLVFALFVYIKVTDPNISRANALGFFIMNALLEGISMIGWVMLFLVSQSNPEGMFSSLAELSMTQFIILFCVLEAPVTIGLVLSLKTWSKTQNN